MSGSLSDDVSALALQVIDAQLAPTRQSLAVQDQRLQELEAMRGLVNDASVLASSVERMVTSTLELIRLSTLVEAELTRITIETTAKRERLASLAPGTLKVLQDMGARIDDLVNKASAIDPRSCTDAEIRWRNRLMDLAQKQSDSLNDGLMRLLA